MRRYSRYKICKTNFHFFFYNSRLLNFNRPKWNVCKEKFLSLKKLKYNPIKVSSFALKYFFNISFLVSSNKLYRSLKSKKKKNYTTPKYLSYSGYNSNTLTSSRSFVFDYEFFNL